MVGAAIGAALFGRRPIVEISFGEFLPAAMNQLINQAPNLHYMTGGAAKVPVVIRTRVGDGPYGGHPQDYSAWFAHVPGLKVVMPAHARRCQGPDAGGHPRRQPGALLRADVAGARPPRGRAGRRAHRADRQGAHRPARGTDVTVVDDRLDGARQRSSGGHAGRGGRRGRGDRPALTVARWTPTTVVASVRKTGAW